MLAMVVVDCPAPVDVTQKTIMVFELRSLSYEMQNREPRTSCDIELNDLREPTLKS